MLTLVIPAYNEQFRLPVMLDVTLHHLRTNRRDVAAQCRRAVGDVEGAGDEGTIPSKADNAGVIEIIVVSDGSTDNTNEIVRSYADAVLRCHPAKNDVLKIVTLHKNSGKGAAVRAGVLRSTGTLVLMVDADGATEFGYGLEKVLDRMAKELGGIRESRRQSEKRGRRNADGRFVGSTTSANDPNDEQALQVVESVAVFGSRAHLEQNSTATRSLPRTVLMHAFHLFVRILCSPNVRDTQCGFKLFTRPAAITLFANLHLRRWAFDTELVVLAERMGMRVSEVGVNWHEVDGSKIDESKMALAWNSLGMLRDMVCVRACYALGIWKLKR